MGMNRPEAIAQAKWRQSQLTKPAGSLGEIEAVAVQLAGIQKVESPDASPAAVAIFAADHPVVARRPEISAYPQDVTAAMVANFQNGGAAACVLAKQHGIDFSVHDVGVVGGNPEYQEGAGDLSKGEAMTKDLFEKSVGAGQKVVRDLLASFPDLRVFIPGEMGIGNTTAASSVVGALLSMDAEAITGRGTGVAEESFRAKIETVGQALSHADLSSPRSVVQTAGGREIAAMFGAMLEAARADLVILVDGFIVSSAALAACQEEPAIRDSLLFSHRSRERGHQLVLAELEATPLLDLDLALGEASGALLAYPLLQSACAIHREMATFESAGVSGACS
ncbi:MAG: nicotinate-nucleotide--dimethylbenzimidazole phosphoribosyltransferase [Verrucomicrobiota bacterium]